jgi:hypothetical protein
MLLQLVSRIAEYALDGLSLPFSQRLGSVPRLDG